MENENGDFQGWPGVRQTLGEILPGGVVYELVQSRSGRGVTLLRWHGQTYEIAPQFKEGEIIYTPGYLHPSLLEATRLPHGPAEYGDPGKLFWKMVDLFRDHIGLSREHGVVITRCVFSTWFPDLCASPITACITGLNMGQIMRLFRLLHVLCRRPLMVAALNTSLPFYFAPTLLINAAERVDENRQFLARYELSRRSNPWPRGHDAQPRLRQDNFLRDGSCADRLGAGSASHRAAADESGFSVFVRARGRTTRGTNIRLKSLCSGCEPCHPCTHPMLLLHQASQDFRWAEAFRLLSPKILRLWTLRGPCSRPTSRTC